MIWVGRDRKMWFSSGAREEPTSDRPAELNYNNSGCLLSICVHFCPNSAWLNTSRKHSCLSEFFLKSRLYRAIALSFFDFFFSTVFLFRRKASCLRRKHNERPVMWKSKRSCLLFYLFSVFKIFILNYNLREAFSSQSDLLQISGKQQISPLCNHL